MTSEIKTPRGRVVQGKDGKAVLEWNSNFVPKWSARYSAAQKFVDSEVVRQCEPFVPLRTGMLVKSGILGTEIGSGWVKWIAPYARYQYYSKREPGSQTGPLRGPHWFERMKAIYKNRIIDGARRLAGGGSK